MSKRKNQKRDKYTVYSWILMVYQMVTPETTRAIWKSTEKIYFYQFTIYESPYRNQIFL